MVNLTTTKDCTGSPLPLTYAQRDQSALLPVHENTIVFEVGSAFFRIGWAGESTPRLVIPSCLGPSITQHESADTFQRNGDYKDSNIRHAQGARKIDNNKGLQFIRPQTADEWIEYLKPKLCHIFVNLLLFNDATPASSLLSSRALSYSSKVSSSSGSRIVVLESSGGLGIISNKNLQCGIAEVLLKYLHFNSLLFVAGGSLISSLYCFPYSDLLGLVLDIGHNEARCCISYQGRYLPQTYQSAPCGFRNVATIFRDLLQKELSKDQHIVSDNRKVKNLLLDDASAILREATVSSNALEAERKSGANASDCSITIGCSLPSTGERIEVPFELVRMAWDKILDGTPGYKETLPEMVLSCLKACPIDMRRAVCHHLIVIGGVTQMLTSKHSADSAASSRLFQRLKLECTHAAQHNPRYNILQVCCREMQACNLPFSPDAMGWIGGSIMGTLPLSEEPSWIFRQAWMERQEQARGIAKASGEKADEESHLKFYSEDTRNMHPSSVLLPDWQNVGKQ